MTRTYDIGHTVIPYEIDWVTDRESVGLSIDESMELTVRAPMEATLDDIEDVLEDKQSWLLEKLYGLSEQTDPPLDKEFLSGEKLLYRGRQYRLDVQEADVSGPKLSFDGSTFVLKVHSFDKPADEVSVRRKRQTVKDWYFRQAGEDLPERVTKYASKLGATDVTIRITELDGRWGEYDDGEVRLNWRLILAPVRIQDYVVVHELAHENYESHSSAFWNAVGSVLPDYESRREWLRLNGRTLTV